MTTEKQAEFEKELRELLAKYEAGLQPSLQIIDVPKKSIIETV
jgi:hypothetical protein